MTDPQRWLDAPDDAPDGLAELLRASSRTRAIPEAARRRGLVRVRRLAAVPMAAATFWMALKSAAAAFGVGAVALVALEVTLPLGPAAPSSSAAQRPGPSGMARAPAAPQAPTPALRPQPEPPSVAPPSGQHEPSLEVAEHRRASTPAANGDFSTVSDDLAHETALLERARATLGASPERALLIVNEHRARFPSGRLAAERTLIEIDALLRLGRGAEARALGERFLAHAPQGLYADRVHALLGSSPP